MKHLQIVALKEDLLAMLTFVESVSPLKYARMGNFSRDDIRDGICVFDTGTAIPNLGKASADSSSACEAFLVCERETPIKLRSFQGSNGERMCVDQLANPESVEFKPGGIWNEDIVLHGRIATASDSYASQALMNAVSRCCMKDICQVEILLPRPNGS